MTGVVRAIVRSPYPGLRPFEADESELFFGREPQVDELLRRLGRSRFVAVIGSSGSGKSSLVRAGLVPALEGGMLSDAGSHWRIAVFRPGGDPVGALADVLCSSLYSPAAQEGSRRDLIEVTLSRSSLGLVEAVRQARLAPYENLLVVVDQFEELFRFHQAHRSPEALDRAAALVRLLLEASRQNDVRIHVLITMRSDFLGDCSQFRDLPETINEGLYLIPRMTRDQFRQAITGPAAVRGEIISPQLVQQLLNDLNNDPDQLPVLQHALMRAWNSWRNKPGDSNVLDVQEYLAIGGMAEALSRHADEAWEDLSESDRRIAERLFQCLTEKGPDNREVRRPTRLGQICRILEEDIKSVKRVIERFREEDRAFLVPPRLIPLDENSVIDISHESLIRKWDRLRGWVEDEAHSRATYLRLAEAARLNRRNEAGLWRNPDLQLALDWKDQTRPNEAWAERYEPDFVLAMDFLNRSVAELREEEMRLAEMRRTEARAAGVERARKRTVVLLAVVAVIAGVIGWLLLKNTRLLKETMASRLATEAALLQSQQDSATEESLLLSLESMRSVPLSLSDEVARNALALLPKQVVRKQYQGDVDAIAFSPDGKFVAAGANDGTVRLVEVATGQETNLPPRSKAIMTLAFSPAAGVRRLALGDFDGNVVILEPSRATGEWNETLRFVHGGCVNVVAFSPDGRYLATGSYDGIARVMDIAAAKEAGRLAHGGQVVALAFSPDGRYLATGSHDATARLMRSPSGQQVWQVKHPDIILGVAFSHDGRSVATASRDGNARVLDAANGREIARLPHEQGVTSVAYSPDDKYVATASRDFTARVMNTNGKEVARLKHQDVVKSVAFYPDGRFIATASDDHTARVMEVATRREVSRIGHQHEVHAIAVDPNGRYLATGSADQSLRIFEKTTGNAIFRDYRINNVNAVGLTPDGRYFALAAGPTEDDRDGSVCVYEWQKHGAQEIAAVHRQPDVNDLTFSPDGKYVAWGGAGGAASVFDIGAGKLTGRQFPHHEPIYAIALSSHSKYLAMGGDNDLPPNPGSRVVEVLELATGHKVASVGHKDRVVTVAFSPDERFLATGSADKTSTVMEIATGKELSRSAHQDQVNSVAFSPDGRRLAVGGADGMLRIIEAVGGREISRYANSNRINGVMFSFDGKIVATANEDGTARLVDAETGREISKIKHPDPVIAMRFISGGRNTLQAFAGNALYEHVLQKQDLFEQACSQLSRNLTPDEWTHYLPRESYLKTCAKLP